MNTLEMSVREGFIWRITDSGRSGEAEEGEDNYNHNNKS